VRLVTDQPWKAIWVETDNIQAMAGEFATSGGVQLQDREDHQVWLIQGYLIALVRTSKLPPQTPRPKMKTLLTAIGLTVLFGLFAFVFIGTLMIMSTR